MATDGFSATINFAIRIPPFCFGLQYVGRQNAALKSDGFGIFFAGLLRLILSGNFKIALVLGVVSIGVKGFFFCLLFLLLLRKSIEAAACRQRNQHDYAQKAGCDLCDLVFLGLFLAGCRRFFCGFLGFFLGFQLILFRLRRCFFFSGISIGSIFLHQSQKVCFVHKVHKVDGLLPLGVAVNHQIESRTRLRHQRNELLSAAIRIVGVVVVYQRQVACSELPNAEEKVIGSYRGFELSLRFDTFRSEYQAILKGQRRYPVALGTDPLGNIIRLDNSLNNFPERINSAENELATLHQQQAAAQIEVEKPFPQEEELAEKSARLAELNAQLDVDEKSHEPEQDEEEQEDAPRRPSVLAALEEKSDKPEPVKPFRSYYDKDGDAR